MGIAIWFLTFSTWTGKNGVWLEDLYVSPKHRGQGLATKLMAQLAAICVERGYPRMEWTVLDWNTSAQEVYRHLGANAMDDWTTQRLTGDSLTALGSRV
ncbi:GNAT family N-acetyltransferase [Ornithinimicrobium sp. INDO-MA30-4]|uniref:GNAT family N-acetyltransferase n=1 Tax=Ornithinimicrobium sp. INDO-MA30-4 TaxID=2908651 RepID=UPI0028834F99|nr:GNAT family N-acetyltransferase [Ornithinimicrobium sp. INDO-MA30-4]